jgi:hypothetical protein
MKRLFWLRTKDGKSAVRGETTGNTIYFEDKKYAKGVRDAYNAGKDKCVLALGPDHWRYGMKGHPRTHSHAASGLSRKKGK